MRYIRVSGTVQYAELITTQHGDLGIYIYLKVRRRKPRTLGDLHVNVYGLPLLVVILSYRLAQYSIAPALQPCYHEVPAIGSLAIMPGRTQNLEST